MRSDWTRAKELLSERIDARDFSTWIEPLVVDNQDDSQLVLKAPNKFVKDWFNEHYADFVHDVLFELTSRNIRLNVSVEKKPVPEQLDFGGTFLRDEPVKESPKKKVARGHFVSDDHGLNPRYNFARFVVGASNQFAYAASISVGKKPGRTFNPLFLYGETGLGKTHLLHGIGHYLLSVKRPPKVVVMTSERFTNEMIQAIRNGHINAFHKKFRQTDALLIDDIQFLSGKERTQEEFFHTFNQLYENGAQIVVTSDRPPKDIERLENRLRSRFSWGLIADIQPAELETRVAILRDKATVTGVTLPEDTAFFLAENFQSNIRELEGAFIRVSAYASLNGLSITTDMAKQVLRTLIGDPDSPVTIEQIQKAVCDHFHIRLSELVGVRRQKNFVLPRQVAGYLSRELTDSSFPEIGRAFGGRDHTTIIHAHRKIGSLRPKDPKLDQTIGELEKRLRGA